MDRSIEPDERKPDEKTPPDHRAGDTQRETPEERRDDTMFRLRETIDLVTQDRPTLSDLIDRLEKAGVRPVPSLQKSGRLNGLSYELDGTRIAGSDLGRAYTALGLQKRKGVVYDPDRDRPRLEEAATRARENPAQGRRPEQGERTRRRQERMREYDGLSAAQRAALREIGRFRTVLSEDFIRIQYRGDRGAWRQDSARLASLKLLEQHSVVVATHSKTHDRAVKALSVVVLTKQGKDLLRRHDPGARSAHQALYSGLVKPREIAHDAAIYRMYQAEAANIEANGGRLKRIVLDFELKKRVYSPLAKAQTLAPAEYARKQAQIAQDNGLKVIEGKIRLPDLRIEYETAAGDAARVDLELATEHYRGEHMGTKDQAGFKIYADSASFPRFGAAGSSGGSRGADEDHIIEIFSF